MRTTTLALALVLVACGRSDDRGSAAEQGQASASSNRGPDPIVLRIPRGGGRVSAYQYPNLDSAIWRSGQDAPPIERVLAFDVEGGLIAAVDQRGLPTRIDLRMGTVSTASRTKFTTLASNDGVAIYGVAPGGSISRLTPSGGEWKHTLPVPARGVFPQADGSVIVAAPRGSRLVFWQLRPPETRAYDSTVVERGGRTLQASLTDRVYVSAGTDLLGVRGRDLEPLQAVSFDAPVRSVTSTPSGDRLYVVTERSRALSVVNRYTEEIAATVALPGEPSELRMDPLGRYVLARYATGDSAWVVSIDSDRLVGAVRTAWRDDLPMVAPDGAIALAQADDVVLVDGATLRPRRTVSGGAADFWHLILWNGFRPRAAGLDQPVQFGGRSGAPSDSAPPDSTAVASDSTAVPPDSVPPDTTTAAPRPAAAPQFNVSFAALASERLARETAERIRVPGQAARVVSTEKDGATLFRVVMGPYATHAEAERVGRMSGRQFWVYEGAP